MEAYTTVKRTLKPVGLIRIHARHRKLFRLAALGIYSQAQMAQIMGLSVSHVNKILNSDLGRRELEKLMSAADLSVIDVLTDLKEMAPLATELYREVLLDDEADLKERLKAAKEVLDRAGFPATKVVEHKPRVGDEEIQKIKQRAKENALKMGLMVEAKVLLENLEE